MKHKLLQLLTLILTKPSELLIAAEENVVLGDEGKHTIMNNSYYKQELREENFCCTVVLCV